MLRRQLPVYSPLPIGAIVGGLSQLIAPSRGAREGLRGTLQSYFSSRQVLLTDSGTHALTLAFRAVHAAHPDRPVALPAYCCYDIATAADGAEVPVALYDVDPKTLGPDFDSLRRVTRAGASAIVAVHLYGIPVDLEAMARQARDAGAALIEDAAQGAGGSYGGKPLGAHGSLAVLSFGRGKGITSGCGGALLANDARGVDLLTHAEIAEPRHRRGTGEVAPLVAQWLLARPWVYGIPASIPWLGLGETHYHSQTQVFGMSDFAVGVLTETWKVAAKEGEVRRKNAEALGGGWPRGSGYLRFPTVPGGGVASPGPGSGVMPGYPKSLADLPGFGGRAAVRGELYSGARALARNLVTGPTHSFVSEGDLRTLRSLRQPGP